jgi:hypothetical protein
MDEIVLDLDGKMEPGAFRSDDIPGNAITNVNAFTGGAVG